MNENILIVISVMECLLDNSDIGTKIKHSPFNDTKGSVFIYGIITFTISAGLFVFNVFGFSGEPTVQYRAT